MNYAFIMRGIPGSGKSSTARVLAQSMGDGEFWVQDGVTYLGHRTEYSRYSEDPFESKILATIHSTDEFFMEKGVYRFNPKLLGRYHRKNFLAFKNSLERDVGVVICDNTNIKEWDFKKYLKEASSYGYATAVVTMPHPKPIIAAERNTHGVPQDVIEKMIRKWESWPVRQNR